MRPSNAEQEHFRYILSFLTLHFLAGSGVCGALQRPFFIIGHMVNSLPEVDHFMERGANSLEVDVQFRSDGTVTRTYHGSPCDCFRSCEGEAPFTEYLDYIRNVTSVGGAKYKDDLRLLFLDLKTSAVAKNQKYRAGADVVNKLAKHLWRNVPEKEAVNVLLYVYSVDDRDLFKGAIDTIVSMKDSSKWFHHIGFDFGKFTSPLEVAGAFADLGIHKHRWQGHGTTNCLVDSLRDKHLPKIVACRDGHSTYCDYVDKAYAWTVDSLSTIEKKIKLGVDGLITNRPEYVLFVINKLDFASPVRPAGPRDRPWTRIMSARRTYV